MATLLRRLTVSALKQKAPPSLRGLGRAPDYRPTESRSAVGKRYAAPAQSATSIGHFVPAQTRFARQPSVLAFALSDGCNRPSDEAAPVSTASTPGLLFSVAPANDP